MLIKEFEQLCEKDAEWNRFKEECMKCKNNKLSYEKNIEIFPLNLIEFAFYQWKEKGVNVFLSEYIDAPPKLCEVTIKLLERNQRVGLTTDMETVKLLSIIGLDGEE